MLFGQVNGGCLFCLKEFYLLVFKLDMTFLDMELWVGMGRDPSIHHANQGPGSRSF